MHNNRNISFKEARTERIAQQAALTALEAAFDDAITNDDWCRMADLEGPLCYQIDRVSTIFQNFQYLENN